jgi:hypothetical protein
MERIKKIEELRVSEGYLLLKLYMKKNLIVAPDSPKREQPADLDYAGALVVGSHITDIKEGDIVLGFQHGDTFKWKEEMYAIVPRMGIKFFIKPENFTNNGGKTKRNLKLEN